MGEASEGGSEQTIKPPEAEQIRAGVAGADCDCREADPNVTWCEFAGARHRAGPTQTDVADVIRSSQLFAGPTERGEQNLRLSTVVRLTCAMHQPGRASAQWSRHA